MLVHLLRRERAIVTAGLLGVVLLSWLHLWTRAGTGMYDMPGMAMPSPAWTPGHAALMLAMWAVMMAAMMLPSAAPMLLLYDALAWKRGGTAKAAGSTGLFGLGYLTVWAGFSVGAVALQYGFHRASLLSPMMEVASAMLAGALLVLAGLYQWTPLKQACLRGCRSPLEFLMTRWRDGPRGAWAMGLRHGANCLGCCWALMLLLFVGGVMNLAWVAGIALYVLIERFAPGGPALGRAVGALLAGWGLVLLGTGPDWGGMP